MDAHDLEGALARARNRTEKLLWLGALLAREIQAEVIVVGGSAIEVYTDGQFVSGDVDVVGDRPKLIRQLESWGFVRSGRLWAREQLELWVDPVGRDYTGDRTKLREFATPLGRVKLASVEDLIAKRLIEIAVWPATAQGLFQQAVTLAAEYRESLDWDYIRKRANREGAGELVDELLRRLNSLDRLLP